MIPRITWTDSVRDVWIDEGRIVSAPTDPAVRPARVIDARGMVVMPGGSTCIATSPGRK